MSHASGTVRFVADNLLLHYEYDGTSDIALPCLSETRADMEARWRNQPWRQCTCGLHEPVKIHSTYGGGFAWDGRACRHCLAIVGPLMPFEGGVRVRDDDWQGPLEPKE